MRKTTIAMLAATVLGVAAAGGVTAFAQPAQPPGAEQAEPGMRGPGGPMGPGFGRPMHPGMMGMGRHMGGEPGMGMRPFGLIYPQADRKLSPADVQKIAEAFLLWNGNHTWKVTEVAPAGDVIGFALSTPDGSVIARFTMDPRTGRVRRTG